MMTTKDFEKKIQDEIDPNLTIRINPNADDIAGVYFNDIYLGVAVPPNEIHKEMSMQRTDATGTPYKTLDFAYDVIKGKLGHLKKALEDDPELFKEEE